MTRLSRVTATVLVAVASVLTVGCSSSATDDANQLSFDTPEQATAALVAALEKRDVPTFRRLLGLRAGDIVSSGDTAADQRDRDAFLARYRVRHQLVAGGPDDLILQVGEDDWPVPVPLQRHEGRWRFDGEAAIHELQARRIGANELRTIDVMRGFVQAQEEYAAVGHDGAAPGIYAQVMRSDPGRQNGLYWEVAAGEPPSPAGPFLAAAAAEGYRTDASTPAPYHGYVYRTLFSQGPAASGGAFDYIVDSKLTKGFALLAYPAQYRVTGVMTFLVNHDGLVWQRDLGDRTSALAAAITQFNPDSTWTPVAPEDAALATRQ